MSLTANFYRDERFTLKTTIKLNGNMVNIYEYIVDDTCKKYFKFDVAVKYLAYIKDEQIYVLMLSNDLIDEPSTTSIDRSSILKLDYDIDKHPCANIINLELAKQHQFDFIEIPGGNPPRSCIGYSLVQLIKVLVAKGFANKQLFSDLEKAIVLLDQENTSIKAESQKIAAKLVNKIAVIYSLGTCEGAVVRFRQQINENSKMLCWHHVFPEMNHNELVGWTEKNDDLVVVTFHTSFDYNRTKKRYEVCKPIFEKYSSGIIDITAKGESKLEQFLYLINIGDWISCDIADLRGIDPVEVNVINHLKGELAKF